MAIVGARPATGLWVFGRRPRPRRRALPRQRPRAGQSVARRAEVRISGVLIAMAVAVGLALFYLSQSSHVAATGYQIDALQSQVELLTREQQQLVLQIGAARSPARIEGRARAALHLTVLPQDAVRFAPGASHPPAD